MCHVGHRTSDIAHVEFIRGRDHARGPRIALARRLQARDSTLAAGLSCRRESSRGGRDPPLGPSMNPIPIPPVSESFPKATPRARCGCLEHLECLQANYTTYPAARGGYAAAAVAGVSRDPSRGGGTGPARRATPSPCESDVFRVLYPFPHPLSHPPGSARPSGSPRGRDLVSIRVFRRSTRYFRQRAEYERSSV